MCCIKQVPFNAAQLQTQGKLHRYEIDSTAAVIFSSISFRIFHTVFLFHVLDKGLKGTYHYTTFINGGINNSFG